MKKELGYLALGAVIAGTVVSGLVHAQTSDSVTDKQFDPTVCEKMHEGKMFGHHGDKTEWLAEHAEMFGMTIDELQTVLDDGQRPHEIAESNGITQEQMQEFMQSNMKEHMAELVADGTITQEQAEQRLEHMEEKAGNMGRHGHFHKRRGLEKE